MTDTKKLSFLLEISQYLIPAWDCTYEEAAKDLIADGVTVQEQGHWTEENPRIKSMMFKCSVCGKTAYYPQPNTKDKSWVKKCGYNFCPNCGAKMKGDSE